MTDYKRFISYLYEYESGEQLSNVGYAKVEARNDQCKLFLHLAAPGWSEKTLKVYIFSRNSPRYQYAYLGELKIQSGVGELKLKTDRENLMESKLSFDRCGGIVAYDSEVRFSACAWDDQEIPQNLVRSISQPSQNQDLKAEVPVIQVVDRKDLEKVDPQEEKLASASEEKKDQEIGKAEKPQEMKQEPEQRNRGNNNRRQEMHSHQEHAPSRQNMQGRKPRMQNAKEQEIHQTPEHSAVQEPVRQEERTPQPQNMQTGENRTGNQRTAPQPHNSDQWLNQISQSMQKLFGNQSMDLNQENVNTVRRQEVPQAKAAQLGNPYQFLNPGPEFNYRGAQRGLESIPTEVQGFRPSSSTAPTMGMPSRMQPGMSFGPEQMQQPGASQSMPSFDSRSGQRPMGQFEPQQEMGFDQQPLSLNQRQPVRPELTQAPWRSRPVSGYGQPPMGANPRMMPQPGGNPQMGNGMQPMQPQPPIPMSQPMQQPWPLQRPPLEPAPFMNQGPMPSGAGNEGGPVRPLITTPGAPEGAGGRSPMQRNPVRPPLEPQPQQQAPRMQLRNPAVPPEGQLQPQQPNGRMPINGQFQQPDRRMIQPVRPQPAGQSIFEPLNRIPQSFQSPSSPLENFNQSQQPPYSSMGQPAQLRTNQLDGQENGQNNGNNNVPRYPLETLGDMLKERNEESDSAWRRRRRLSGIVQSSQPRVGMEQLKNDSDPVPVVSYQNISYQDEFETENREEKFAQEYDAMVQKMDGQKIDQELSTVADQYYEDVIHQTAAGSETLELPQGAENVQSQEATVGTNQEEQMTSSADEGTSPEDSIQMQTMADVTQKNLGVPNPMHTSSNNSPIESSNQNAELPPEEQVEAMECAHAVPRHNPSDEFQAKSSCYNYNHTLKQKQNLVIHPIAQSIFTQFPKIYPFEDNEITNCVRIEPQNIGLLPIEAWVLGNNSFLLHGYYSYKHLIFGKINQPTGYTYVLGVPGIYHNRERFMARMFGFSQFKCAKKTEKLEGEFGYWYLPIILN